jgi:hypothetical protein
MTSLSQQIEHLAGMLSKPMPDGNREILATQYNRLLADKAQMENAHVKHRA